MLEVKGTVRETFFPQWKSNRDRPKPIVLQHVPLLTTPPPPLGPHSLPWSWTPSQGAPPHASPILQADLGQHQALGAAVPDTGTPLLWGHSTHVRISLSSKWHHGPSQSILTACSMSASTYELSQWRPGCRRAPSSTWARAPSSVGSRWHSGLSWQNRISLTSPSMRRT